MITIIVGVIEGNTNILKKKLGTWKVKEHCRKELEHWERYSRVAETWCHLGFSEDYQWQMVWEFTQSKIMNLSVPGKWFVIFHKLWVRCFSLIPLHGFFQEKESNLSVLPSLQVTWQFELSYMLLVTNNYHFIVLKGSKFCTLAGREVDPCLSLMC